MKIINLKIRKDISSLILSGTIVVGSIGGAIMYYTYNNTKQLNEESIDSSNVFIDENGSYNCYFEIGEHIIQVTRNDAYYHEYNATPGYTISKVETNCWRDNCKITYVNNQPVIATATNTDNEQLKFDKFGTIADENVKTYIKKTN